ncbi:MAG: ABC transporter ATP-binding protein [Acidimicrobiales bacterium]
MSGTGAGTDASVARRGLRVVASHVRRHPWPFTVAMAGAVLFAGATVLTTVVLGRFADDIVLPAFAGESVPVAAAVGALVAVTVLRVSGVVMRRYFAGMAAERVQRSIRHELADHYLAAPTAWHQERSAGELLAHADNDTEVSTEVLHPLPFSVGVLFLVVFAALSLWLVDVVMALVAFAVFPALAVLNQVYSRTVEAPAAAIQANVGRVSAIASESFDGALVVKTLGRAEAEGERFAAAVDRLRVSRVRVGFIRAAFEPVMDALPNLGTVLVVGLGLWRVDAGAMRPGELVQVAALFSILAFPMRVLGYFLESLPPSVVAHDRLLGVFSSGRRDPASTQAGGAARLPDGPLQVTVTGLTYGYPGDDRRVLDGVDFGAPAGEVVAVVGSTGSGKSTLSHLVAGLMAPTSGSVALGGVALHELAETERVDAVALVFQESFLFADTLAANIDLSGRATSADLAWAVELAQVGRFLDDLPDGLDTVVGERGVTLSGGQRQRVALARALLRRPRLLILDDATSAVDARVEKEILDGLRRELEMTTIVVAQRLSTIALANRVVYLEHGRTAGDGTHAELLELPGYAALVRAYEERSA